jgi:hypothetical protein
MIQSIDELPGVIRGLAAAGKLRGERWTLAQIAEHLARTVDWMLGRLRLGAAPQRPSAVRQFIGRRIVFATGRLPRGVPTFAEIAPPAETDLEAALGHLERSLAEMGRFEGPLPQHPYLGRMSRAGWMRFHVIHARHHLRTIR